MVSLIAAPSPFQPKAFEGGSSKGAITTTFAEPAASVRTPASGRAAGAES